MSRKILGLSIVSCAVLSAMPAHAQTMPSWQGMYGGVQGGYGFSAADDAKTTGQAAINVTNVNSGARPGSVEVDAEGFLGGIQVGQNWQRDRFVYGFETDIAYTDIDESKNQTGSTGLANNYKQELDYLGTLRGRVGYAYDRVLVFGTGGLAYGGVDNEATFFGPAGQEQFKGGESGFEVGYTLGAGAEVMLTEMVSLKSEYLYYDLGDNKADVAVIPGSGGGGTGYDTKFDNSGHIIRAGLNYKF